MATDSAALASAVQQVRAGGLLAYPTETVWGLGADAGSEEAVAALRGWKGRDEGQPISLLVSGTEALRELGVAASPAARALAERFWPGPLTLVLPAAAGRFAPGIARADGAVGLRCSSHPVAAALARALRAAGVGPLTATSLNRTGELAARSAEEARKLCAEHPGPMLVAPGNAGPVSSATCEAPSTVVDCTGPAFALIREGAIPAAALAEAAGAECTTARQGDEAPR